MSDNKEEEKDRNYYPYFRHSDTRFIAIQQRETFKCVENVVRYWVRLVNPINLERHR